jgi:hemerythrin-like domain-containing protein
MGMRFLNPPPPTGRAPDPSPLSIPLEEHEAGHERLLRIRDGLHDLEAGRGSVERVREDIQSYVWLLRFQIEKEDTCLFVLADQILDSETEARLLHQAQELERLSTTFEAPAEMILRLKHAFSESL